MNDFELLKELDVLGFNQGFVIKSGKIVLWENEDSVPTQLEQYIELDEVDNANY